MMPRMSKYGKLDRAVKAALRQVQGAIPVGMFLLAGFTANGTVIFNGSFEDLGGSFAANQGQGVMQLNGSVGDAGTISGWDASGGITSQGHASGIAWESNNNASGFKASAGNFFLNLGGYDGSSHRGGVTLAQSLSTIQGQSYRLSFDLGSCSVANGDPVGPVVRVTLNGQPSTESFTGASTFVASPLETSHWQTETLVFQATSSATFISFNNCTDLSTTTEAFVGLDNVSIMVVPEGGTWCSGMGAVVLCLTAIRFGSKGPKLSL